MPETHVQDPEGQLLLDVKTGQPGSIKLSMPLYVIKISILQFHPCVRLIQIWLTCVCLNLTDLNHGIFLLSLWYFVMSLLSPYRKALRLSEEVRGHIAVCHVQVFLWKHEIQPQFSGSNPRGTDSTQCIKELKSLYLTLLSFCRLGS